LKRLPLEGKLASAARLMRWNVYIRRVCRSSFVPQTARSTPGWPLFRLAPKFTFRAARPTMLTRPVANILASTPLGEVSAKLTERGQSPLSHSFLVTVLPEGEPRSGYPDLWYDNVGAAILPPAWYKLMSALTGGYYPPLHLHASTLRERVSRPALFRQNLLLIFR